MAGNKVRGTFFAVVWWLLAVGWIYVLFYLSRQTAENSAQLSNWFAQGLLRRLPFLSVSEPAFEAFLRKLAHFGIFAVEGFLIRMALFATKSRRFFVNTLIAAILCLPLAVTNELSQLTAAGRVASVRDMGIDMAGAILGILVSALLAWIWESAVIRRRYRRMGGAR